MPQTTWYTSASVFARLSKNRRPGDETRNMVHTWNMVRDVNMTSTGQGFGTLKVKYCTYVCECIIKHWTLALKTAMVL